MAGEQHIVVDTSALLTLVDHDEPRHAELTQLMASSSARLVVSPYVVAETDYLVMRNHGVRAELALLRDLATSAWELADVSTVDLLRIADVVEAYADQRIGVTDASLVILAARYGTTTIATLDHRHFDVLRSLDGRTFTVIP